MDAEHISHQHQFRDLEAALEKSIYDWDMKFYAVIADDSPESPRQLSGQWNGPGPAGALPDLSPRGGLTWIHFPHTNVGYLYSMRQLLTVYRLLRLG